MFDERRFAFLFKRCKPLTSFELRTWLSVPEFTNAIIEAEEKKVYIDRKFVLETMKEISGKFYARFGEQSRFQDRNFVRVIRKLERVLEEENQSAAV